jgi:hypothetical protein
VLFKGRIHLNQAQDIFFDHASSSKYKGLTLGVSASQQFSIILRQVYRHAESDLENQG